MRIFAQDSPFLVPFDGSFRIADAPTAPSKKEKLEKEVAKERLRELIEELDGLQKKLYADDRYSLLLVFQAMDAAGKDGTVRAVLTGVNPMGCQVFAFKAPSDEELDHEFLWRMHRAAPERGRIGVWNRSHYEEVIVVRVHDEILERQKLPPTVDRKNIWKERYESIRGFEEHLARNGTVVIKFFLNVSRDEQLRRLLDRIDDPEANWKFSARDCDEREHWERYMDAYQQALRETSKAHAPWYAIPADSKPFMRVAVAEIVVQTLKDMKLAYPKLGAEAKATLGTLRARLIGDEQAADQKKGKKKKGKEKDAR